MNDAIDRERMETLRTIDDRLFVLAAQIIKLPAVDRERYDRIATAIHTYLASDRRAMT